MACTSICEHLNPAGHRRAFLGPFGDFLQVVFILYLSYTSYWQSLIVAQFDTIHAHALTYSQRHCLSLSIIRLGVRAQIGIGAVSVD